MAQEKPNRLSEWADAVRTQAPVIRERLGVWVSAVRDDPVLLWQTAAVRYPVYVVGAVMLFWAVSGIAAMFTPAPPAGTRPKATTADFHVICTNPACGRHFVIRREFGFDNFPVVCPTCTQKTGMPARRCYSDTCRGRWVAPVQRDNRWHCPVCGAPFE